MTAGDGSGVSGLLRFVGHPVCLGALALWLGTALGSLNSLLLALWRFLVAAFLRELLRKECARSSGLVWWHKEPL